MVTAVWKTANSAYIWRVRANTVIVNRNRFLHFQNITSPITSSDGELNSQEFGENGQSISSNCYEIKIWKLRGFQVEDLIEIHKC